MKVNKKAAQDWRCSAKQAKITVSEGEQDAGRLVFYEVSSGFRGACGLFG